MADASTVDAAGKVPADRRVGLVAVLRHPGTTRRRFAPVAVCVLACLLSQACQPASTTGPLTTGLPAPGTSVPTAGTTQRPSTAPVPGIPLADALRDAVSADRIVADLDQLQSITMAHGGARPAGGEGHAAAASFAADELRAAGYQVELQQVELPVFRQTGPSTLEITGAGGRAFEDLRDFKAMLFSPSGEVTAPVFALGFDPGAGPEDSAGLGCNPEDWTDVPGGVIVLVQPAGCRRHDVVVQAQQAGAVGIVTSYPAWARDAVLRPTLIQPADIRIPAIGVSGDVGLALNAAAASGAKVHISVHASNENGSSVNVIAETPWGDPAHVVMLGGHLDSVIDGPGMNDDGSGTMTVLGIAKALAAETGMTSGGGSAPPASAWKVRVGLWTGEEIGLWGSRAYLDRLASPQAIAAYLNFDMVASPNGVRLVYDGASTVRAQQSLVIQALFTRALDALGLTWQTASLGGSSDHASFDQASIPIGGLFSGANERKTRSQADLFGGTAGAAEDPCLHLPCDTTDKLDRTLLDQLARAGAWVVGALASGEVALAGT